MQERVIETGGRLVKHARYHWLLLVEGHLTRPLFGVLLQRPQRYHRQRDRRTADRIRFR